MSETIAIRNNKKVPANKAIKDVLMNNQISIYEYPEEPLDYYNCKLYVPGKSNLGVVINQDRDYLSIWVNYFCNDADIDLALYIARTLSLLCESDIFPGGYPEIFSWEDVDNGELKRYLFNSTEGESASFLKSLIYNDMTVKLEGIDSDFYPDKTLIEEDVELMDAKVNARFLEIQNLEDQGVRITNPIVADMNGKKQTYVVISVGHRQLIANCDMIVLAGEG